jgi:hypothetical protein
VGEAASGFATKSEQIHESKFEQNMVSKLLWEEQFIFFQILSAESCCSEAKQATPDKHSGRFSMTVHRWACSQQILCVDFLGALWAESNSALFVCVSYSVCVTQRSYSRAQP